MTPSRNAPQQGVEVMPLFDIPLYIVLMTLYTILLAFIIYIIVVLTFQSKNKWEQVMSVFILVPYVMRLLFLK
jgi:ABC-type polysaccharide/polyol phosphate export permease